MTDNTEKIVAAANNKEKTGRITVAVQNQIGNLFMQIINLQDTNTELTKQTVQLKERIELLEKEISK